MNKGALLGRLDKKSILQPTLIARSAIPNMAVPLFSTANEHIADVVRGNIARVDGQKTFDWNYAVAKHLSITTSGTSNLPAINPARYL